MTAMHTGEIDEIGLLNGRVRLQVPPGGLRPSIDSVLVAAACRAGAGDHILDLGCGVGSVGLCIAARVSGVQLTGVDIQNHLTQVARRNAGLNNVIAATYVCQDIADFASADMLNRFDHVVCNPPFLQEGSYEPSPDPSRNTALGARSLIDWLKSAHHAVASRGTLTLIHRADALDDIILGLGKRFGAIEIIPLWPHVGEAARRVIVRAVKDSRAAATLHAGVVLHETDGRFTDVAQAVLRDAGVI